MKRKGNLYQSIISKENLILAATRARKGKGNQYGVKLYDKNAEKNIDDLHLMLKSKTYRTSAYTNFKIYEPKERLVSRLPFFPDRIVHHAIMVYLEDIFVAMFTADSYSCIKGKGIHGASFSVRRYLKDVARTKYCLKLDVKKFYPSINHDILKALLRRKFKDPDLLWLLDEIIDSAPGVPIGNYLSQYFANFFLTGFDHWLKEKMCVWGYVRYSDDMVIPHDDKKYLHWLLAQIREYLWVNLGLEVKDNYQIFLVEARGINVVGYVHFHTHVLIRPSIKKRFARQVFRRKDRASFDSYNGWLKWGNCINLTRKILYGIKKV